VTALAPLAPLTLLSLLALLALLPSGDGDEALADHPGRAAFIRACARCHGEDGSGRGTTELERPARSFEDGGFSFGNTPEAIMNTIRGGIPGSSMPAFEGAWDEDALRELAEFVIALGPERTTVARGETVLSVGEQARVVRGALPPISQDAAPVPRGLLVGLPGGLSFEYRYDEVALLGVRYGELVERSDWTGRGGTPLVPLGRLVWTSPVEAPVVAFETVRAFVRSHDPEQAPFVRAGGLAPVTVAGRGTRLDGPHAEILVALRRDGSELAAGTLAPLAVPTSLGTGFGERWALRPGGLLRAALRLGPADVPLDRFTTPAPREDTTPALWLVTAREDGVEVLVVRATEPGLPQVLARDGERLLLAFASPRRPDAPPVAYEIVRLLLPEWTDEARATLTRELWR